MKTFVSMVAWVVILGLLVSLSLFGIQRAMAQTSDYTTTWTATDLIVARLHSPVTGNSQSDCTQGSLLGSFGNPNGSEVALGVAKWTVKGQLTGSTRYKEMWSVPTLPYAFTYGGDWVNGSCQNLRLIFSGNSNVTEWLLGYFQNETISRSAIAFRTVGVGDTVNALSNVDSGRVSNTGKTTSCQLTNRCLFTTGAYSWNTFHEIEEAQDSKPINAGTLIPLKWTIAGYLCEPGDNRCN